MAQKSSRAKADARAATITVTFASGVTGGEAKIGTPVTITTSVAFATITEVDWGDGTTNTSASHTYNAAATGRTVGVTDGTDTGTSAAFNVTAAAANGAEPGWGEPVSRQASQSTYATTTTPPDGPLTVQTLSKPGPG